MNLFIDRLKTISHDVQTNNKGWELFCMVFSSKNMQTALDCMGFHATFNALDCMRFRATFGFVCVEVLRPSQPNGVMSSVVSLPNHVYWAGLVL